MVYPEPPVQDPPNGDQTAPEPSAVAPSTQPRRAPLWMVALVGAIAAVGGLAAGVGIGLALGEASTDRSPVVGSGRPVDEDPDDRRRPPPPPPAYEPEPEDFELTIRTLSKECFGTAGCNVTFRIELSYGGPDLDPSQTYELTYEVLGGEEPLINTLEVVGDQYSVEDEEFIGTNSSDAELTAVVLDVVEG